ncbi:MAG TPA: hypothetical protein VN678_04435 [Acidobacteriaceae bacterium]|nr:hypothetical protein [Acidobacteriaceae bacterium]
MASAAQLVLQESVVPARGGSRSRWLPYAIVIAVVLAGYCMEHALRPVPAFPYDDPYIDLHSAQVLHTGHDANYPGVPALFGVTSAPFVGLIYLLLFVLPPLQALNAACWVGVLLYALGLVRLTRVLRVDGWQQALLVFTGLVSVPVPIHWINGLETSCALAAITWTLSFAAGERRGWLAAGLVAGVTATVRPDLVIFAVLIVGFLAWETARSPEGGIRTALGLALAAAVPIGLCALWYFHQIGTPFPLTGIAKRYFFAEDRWPLAKRLSSEGIQLCMFLGVCGPLSLALLRMDKSRLGKVLLAVWGLFLLALFSQFPGEFGVNEFRYPVVLIPTLLWGLGTNLHDSDPVQRTQARRMLALSAGFAALMLAVCFHFYNGERRFFEAGPRQVTLWCNQHLPPGTPVLVHDAGYLAYSSSFPTLDFVGLKTPQAIPLNKRYTWPTAGKGRAQVVAQMALDSGSRYLVINSHWWPVVTLDEELRAQRWGVDLVDREGAFRIYKLTPPSARSRP